jgi:hypothetical protein
VLLTWPVVIAFVLIGWALWRMHKRSRRPAERHELRAVEAAQVIVVHQAAGARQAAGEAMAETAELRERVDELERRAA